MRDIVVISDTEEQDDDDEVAFVSHTQAVAAVRGVTHGQAGPTGSAPIFIDSDDEPMPEFGPRTVLELDHDEDLERLLGMNQASSSSSRTQTVITTIPSSQEFEVVEAVTGSSRPETKGKGKGKGKAKATSKAKDTAGARQLVGEIDGEVDWEAEFDLFESSMLSKQSGIDATKPTGAVREEAIPSALEAATPTGVDQITRPEKKRKSSGEQAVTAVPTGEKRHKATASAGAPAEKLSKEEKEAVKAREKAEKQLAKQTAKAAKEAEKSYQRKLAEVNRLRTSKNEAVREIHLYLSADLALPAAPIAPALPEIRTRITDNHSEVHVLPEADSPVPGVIRFKRHIKARWDTTAKQFIPLEESHWAWEGTILIVVHAEQVVDLIAAGGDDLSTWAGDVRLTLGMGQTDQMIVMIKGLQKYYSKIKNQKNKEHTAAVRAGLDGRVAGPRARGGANAASSAGATSGLTKPEKDQVEMALVELQVKQRCFLIQVEKTEDIEDWVYNISADVALRPYKLISKSHLNFCPTDNVKRKSTDPTEAFELMLQEVTGITPSAAMGIAAEYPTFRVLMETYEKAERRGGEERGEIMLQDCEIKTLRNGTANGRKLNKALSKRVYNVFRGEDSLALA
ncbi:hypothetical protein IAU60_000537 [Kwoniella sp. DSM 27419]